VGVVIAAGSYEYNHTHSRA